MNWKCKATEHIKRSKIRQSKYLFIKKKYLFTMSSPSIIHNKIKYYGTRHKEQYRNCYALNVDKMH